jgi:hypothetical protein
MEEDMKEEKGDVEQRSLTTVLFYRHYVACMHELMAALILRERNEEWSTSKTWVSYGAGSFDGIYLPITEGDWFLYIKSNRTEDRSRPKKVDTRYLRGRQVKTIRMLQDLSRGDRNR